MRYPIIASSKWLRKFANSLLTNCYANKLTALRLYSVCYANVCSRHKNSRHFLDQSEVKPKQNTLYSRACSCAGRLLPAFAWASDWFIVLFTSLVTGQGTVWQFLREFNFADWRFFLCFVGTNFCYWKRLVFLAGN